jgi:hypothetical protein
VLFFCLIFLYFAHMTLAYALPLETSQPSTVNRLVRMNPQKDDLGFGWRLMTFKAKDAKTAQTLKEWFNANRKWYGFGINGGIRGELQVALNKTVAGKNRIISLPSEKTIIPTAVAKPSGITTRKSWDEKNKSLHFWIYVAPNSKETYSTEAYSTEAIPGVVLLVGALIAGLIGFWISDVSKKVDVAVSKVESVTQPITAASAAAQTGVAQAAAAVTPTKIQQTFADNSGNPLLWGGVALMLLFATMAIRQLRGAGRDLGSAVRSTNDQVRADLDDLADNPTPPSGSRRRK